MITTTSSSGSFVDITITYGGWPEPPPDIAGQPARPRRPQGGPPVLAGRRAPDGSWDVPVTRAELLVRA